jgi:hypothetical protein
MNANLADTSRGSHSIQEIQAYNDSPHEGRCIAQVLGRDAAVLTDKRSIHKLHREDIANSLAAGQRGCQRSVKLQQRPRLLDD